LGLGFVFIVVVVFVSSWKLSRSAGIKFLYQRHLLVLPEIFFGYLYVRLLGTGKTITGVHIAYWFAKRNRQNTPPRRTTPVEEIPEKAPPQVLYCGPSNKSVDVVAGAF